MRVRVRLSLDLGDDRLAEAAVKALAPDNVDRPEGMRIECLHEGGTLVVEVEHDDVGSVLYAVEDVFTCLKPVLGLPKLTSAGDKPPTSRA